MPAVLCLVVPSTEDRLREFREHLAESEAMLVLARRTHQSTEVLEFVVEKLRALIADAERDLGFNAA